VNSRQGGFPLKQAQPSPINHHPLLVAFLFLVLFLHISSDDTHTHAIDQLNISIQSFTHSPDRPTDRPTFNCLGYKPHVLSLSPFLEIESRAQYSINTTLAYQALSCFNCKLLPPPFLTKIPQNPIPPDPGSQPTSRSAASTRL
jgi:hypothetical protein